MKKTNLLIMMSDQHHSEFLSRGKDSYVQTPGLDRLIDSGVSFNNAYCPFPLCVPARMALLTGRHCFRIGSWGNSDSLSSAVPTFAHGLGIAGYRTVLAGRMHFIGRDQHHGFQERLVGDVSSPFLGRNRAEYRNRGFFGIDDSIRTSGAGTAHDLVFDQAVATEACKVIRDHEETNDPRPLCLMVSFYSPHDPYRVYGRYFQQYRDKDDLPIDYHGEAVDAVYKDRVAKQDDLKEEDICRARAAYRGKVTFMDELYSMVMECFGESKLSEDAIQVYFSDHGDMMGEHGMWGKSVFYDGASKVPLIISSSSDLPIGKQISQPVSMLDIGPTILDLAGADPLPNTDGKSLVPMITGEDDSASRPVYCEMIGPNRIPARMVRSEKWKLNYFTSDKQELFDLEKDPEECHNLAENPEHTELISQLKELIFADGWDPDEIARELNAQGPDYQYLARWTKAVEPKDPIMWGTPAPL